MKASPDPVALGPQPKNIPDRWSLRSYLISFQVILSGRFWVIAEARMESEQTGRWEQTLQKQTRGEQAQPASWSNYDFDPIRSPSATERSKPTIARRFSLTQARQAQELLGKGGVMGKIVLVCNGASFDAAAA